MVLSLLLVGIGGGLGSMLRFYISMKCHKHFIGTWVANITGSLLLGIMFKFYHVGAVTEEMWLLVGIGFCGAYTTFSTFGNETVQLLLSRRFSTAILYVVSSFVVSIVLVSIVWVI